MPCGVEPVDRVHHADPERRLDLAGLARGQERVEPLERLDIPASGRCRQSLSDQSADDPDSDSTTTKQTETVTDHTAFFPASICRRYLTSRAQTLKVATRQEHTSWPLTARPLIENLCQRQLSARLPG